MLCSNCGQRVDPVVAIDIDGTLGDYHGHFLNFASDYLDIRKDPPETPWRYDGGLRFSTWFTEVFNCSIETYRQVKLAYRQGGMKRTMPIFTGAQAICGLVRDLGGELWVTTTRPYLSLDNIVPDTVEWLRRHEIEYDGMLFDEDKYEQLSDRVDSGRVVAILDDLPEQILAAKSIFGAHVPILVKNQYNAASTFVLTSSLDAAADIVNARIRGWWRDHA